MNRQNNVVETFVSLVQIDSPTGEEQQVATWIQHYLDQIGITNHGDNVGNVVAHLSGNQLHEPVLLTAHMDTVEPGRSVHPQIDETGWIRSNGKTVLGADNKAGIAIILEGLRALATLREDERVPLDIVFTVSEESENIGASNLDYTEITARKGYAFDDAGPIGNVTIAAPAYTRFMVRVTGRSAHASEPEQAENVVPALSELFRRIPTGRINPTTLLNIGTGSLGSATNVVPGIATFVGEIRAMDERDIEQVIADIEHIRKEVSVERRVTITMEPVRENGALNLGETDPFVEATLEKVREVVPAAHSKKSWGCSDANIFIDHGISVLNIADGSLHPHALEETIHTSSLVTMVKLLTNLIRLTPDIL